MKKVLCLLLAVLLLLPCGCWDMAEINQRIFVIGLAIDETDSDGLYKFTFHYAIASGEETSVQSNRMNYRDISVRSASLAAALREITRNTDSQVSLEHLNALVISDALAQTDFLTITDALFRVASVRRKCAVVVSDCAASDLLTAKLDSDPALSISELVTQYNGTSGNVLEAFSLQYLYVMRENDLSFYLLTLNAVPQAEMGLISSSDDDSKAQSTLYATGLACFINGEYTGKLGATELETVRLLSNRQAQGMLEIVDEDSMSSFYQLVSSSCSKKCEIVNDEPVFDIRIKVDCELVETSGRKADSPEDMIEDCLKERVESLAFLGRARFGLEILGLESITRQSHRDWFEQNRDYWVSGRSHAVINITVECTISSEGFIN